MWRLYLHTKDRDLEQIIALWLLEGTKPANTSRIVRQYIFVLEPLWGGTLIQKSEKTSTLGLLSFFSL